MSSKSGYTRLSLEEEHEQDHEPQEIADAVTDSSAVGADVLPVATVEIDMGDSKQEFPIATGELVNESDIDVELPVAAAVFFIWVQIPGRPKPLRVDLPDGPQTRVSHVKAAIASASSHSYPCLLYTSPSPRDRTRSRMPSSA